jgi:hypothetical protein
MSFRREETGKQVFISMDSRRLEHNPLYNAFKAKSFTDKDITLHFYILDCLTPGKELSLMELVDEIEEAYLCQFPDAQVLDVSTLRKKLKEYEVLGLVQIRKRGKVYVYSRCENTVDLDQEKAEIYMQGNVLETDRRGWCLVTADGYSLGWGKGDGRQLKNHYPKGLRRFR